MWRTAVGLALVGVWLGTAGVVPALAAPAQCGEPVAAPTYQVGETWAWRDEKGKTWSAEVIAVEADLTQIKWDHGHVAYLDKDWILQKMRRPDGTLVTAQGAGA